MPTKTTRQGISLGWPSGKPRGVSGKAKSQMLKPTKAWDTSTHTAKYFSSPPLRNFVLWLTSFPSDFPKFPWRTCKTWKRLNANFVSLFCMKCQHTTDLADLFQTPRPHSIPQRIWYFSISLLSKENCLQKEFVLPTTFLSFVRYIVLFVLFPQNPYTQWQFNFHCDHLLKHCGFAMPLLCAKCNDAVVVAPHWNTICVVACQCRSANHAYCAWTA